MEGESCESGSVGWKGRVVEWGGWDGRGELWECCLHCIIVIVEIITTFDLLNIPLTFKVHYFEVSEGNFHKCNVIWLKTIH